MARRFAPVARQSVERYGPGERVVAPQPGDFILTHETAWTSQFIQSGQALRIYGADRKYCYWNHAAIFVDADGTIIEALGTGVCQNNVEKYTPTEYHVVRIVASPADRDEVATFARSCLDEEYGYLTIVSIALSLLTGAKINFGFDGQQICSGLVARSLERTTAIFNKTPSHIMPADLAKYYQVEPPS